jgi:phosphonate transport system substrate-binding protein
VLRRVVATTILTALLAVSGCAGAAPGHGPGGLPATLKVGVIPNINPDQQRVRYQPFADYLAGKVGVKVELFVATDYAGVVAALAAKRIDVAYLGGLTYVQAQEQVPLTPLVTEIDVETDTRKYLSAVVVRADSPIQRTRDLVEGGKSFAFGDVSSTSGSLYPRIMLTAAGASCEPRRVDSCPPLAKVSFTGGHDAVAKAVLGGAVDAGGLELRILHRLEKRGDVPRGALRVIDSREVMGYPWVVRQDLGPEVARLLVDAFQAIADPELLATMRAKRYERVTIDDYAEIRTQAATLGLLQTATR